MAVRRRAWALERRRTPSERWLPPMQSMEAATAYDDRGARSQPRRRRGAQTHPTAREARGRRAWIWTAGSTAYRGTWVTPASRDPVAPPDRETHVAIAPTSPNRPAKGARRRAPARKESAEPA